MKQKKVIIVAVALLAVVLIIAGATIALMQGGDSYAAKIEDGYRYLKAGDFDNAILMFRYAMEEDSTREDAYYGLYQAYLHSGQSGLAETTLRMGVTNTRSTRLQDLLIELDAQKNNGNLTQTTDPTVNVNNQQTDNKNVSAALNTDMLTLFGSATYGDYCMRYGSNSGTMNGTQFTRYLDRLGATLYYYDTASVRVLDTGRGVPYNEFLPNQIVLDNVTSLFGVNELSYDILSRMNGVSNASRNGNTVTFTYQGCDVTIICTDSGVINAACENYIIPTGKPGAVEKEYKLSASIVDATTGAPVVGAKVSLYQGYSAFGEAEEGTTDSTGRLVLEMEESGVYTAVVSKDGYITENFEVFIMSNLMETQEVFHISPVMNSDGIRFVLSWGASPSDLDSHLIGTAGDGSYVDVSFSNMYAINGSGDKVAELDVDDVTSYGPETITLYDTAGSYEFYVDDFTDSGTISSSGATVKIYVGSTLYATVAIPGGIEDQWHVCTIDNGTVTVTNRSR